MNDFYKITGYDYEPPVFDVTPRARPRPIVDAVSKTVMERATPQPTNATPVSNAPNASSEPNAPTASASQCPNEHQIIHITNEHILIIIIALICIMVWITMKLNKIEALLIRPTIGGIY